MLSYGATCHHDTSYHALFRPAPCARIHAEALAQRGGSLLCHVQHHAGLGLCKHNQLPQAALASVMPPISQQGSCCSQARSLLRLCYTCNSLDEVAIRQVTYSHTAGLSPQVHLALHLPSHRQADGHVLVQGLHRPDLAAPKGCDLRPNPRNHWDACVSADYSVDGPHSTELDQSVPYVAVL